MRGPIALLLLVGACSFSGPNAGTDDAPDDAPDPDAPDDSPDADEPDMLLPDAPGERRRDLLITQAMAGDLELTNFPLWVDITDADLQAVAATDGSNIDFRRSDGTPYEYDLIKYEAGTGRLRAWVRATVGSMDRHVFLHYGGTSATPEEPATVYSESFDSVWHLDGTGDDVRDLQDAAAVGTPVETTDGKLGSAFTFNSVDDGFQFENAITGGGASTISAWVKPMPVTAGSYGAIFAVGSAANNQARFFDINYGGNGIGVGFFANDWNPGTNLLPGQWSLVHWTYNSSRVTRVYVNGMPVPGTNPHQTAANTTGGTGYIGRSPPMFGPTSLPNNATNPFAGEIDEVRLSRIARSAEWIRAEYLNQNGPGFYSVGPVELVED